MPSCGPTNVSAFATTSSSILVRWGDVPQPDRNGLILGYKVGNRSNLATHSTPASFKLKGFKEGAFQRLIK